MKRFYVFLLACIMSISFGVPASSIDVKATTGDEALPEAEALLSGYEKMDGLDQNDPKILSITNGDTPSEHVKVSGCFGDGDTATWNIYLPKASEFEGRFYQRVYPFDTNNLQTDLVFSFSSGAYQVEHYSLGNIVSTASIAHLSRTIAKNYYDYDEYIYGYAYGGSGGSYQMIGLIEGQAPKVFDGAVPFVMCIPTTLGMSRATNLMSIVLGDQAEQIYDAVKVGGSGDPYEGLTQMQSDVLEEIVKLGIPWSNWASVVPGYVAEIDANTLPAGYVDAFWNDEGYLGTEDSELGDFFRDLREAGTYTDATLAASLYHRYADPGESYYMWDHLRGLYPQYSLYPPNDAMGTAAFLSSWAAYDGDINCKVMVIQNTMDGGAFATNADWYRQRVIESGKEDDYRIYMNDNAAHLDYAEPENADVVQYLGILEQALRDMAAWVEDGIEPAESTNYEVKDTQVVLAKNASARKGLQPVAILTADGKEHGETTTGQAIEFKVDVQLPAIGGEIVSVEWDFLGNSEFEALPFTTLKNGDVYAKENYLYTEAGTYFPKVRVTSKRDGDTGTRVASVQNFGRARVTVTTDSAIEIVVEKKKSKKDKTKDESPVEDVVDEDQGSSEEDGKQKAPKKFKDIDEKFGWAKKAIDVLSSLGIVEGTSESTFEPDKKMKRGDFALMLVRALSLEADSDESFEDVEDEDYYSEAIKTIRALGITNGDGEGRFNPEGQMTREDMMVLVARALSGAGLLAKSDTDVDMEGFDDVDMISDYAKESVKLLIGAGLINGDGSGINPKGTATRAEMAVLIERILNLNNE